MAPAPCAGASSLLNGTIGKMQRQPSHADGATGCRGREIVARDSAEIMLACSSRVEGVRAAS
jgi:hypothetical protein